MNKDQIEGQWKITLADGILLGMAKFKRVLEVNFADRYAVVQPGVEFDHHKVIDYDRAKAARLSRALDGQPHIVFEAHSTDYQTPKALKALVEDHFAILKVGPGVTFALREAFWALDAIERE
mgnify:CR=1 FL=1